MENASKALLMAGGVLIAVLIIGVLVYSMGTIGEYFTVQQSQEEIEQLTAFNNQYEAYNRKLLRGTDVISVMNKALNNNKKYTEANGYDEEAYKISIEFEITEKMVYKKETVNKKLQVVKVENITFEAGVAYNQDNFEEKIKNNTDMFTDFKRRIFDCVEIKYNQNTGRVNYMKFKERTINYTDVDTF